MDRIWCQDQKLAGKPRNLNTVYDQHELPEAEIVTVFGVWEAH